MKKFVAFVAVLAVTAVAMAEHHSMVIRPKGEPATHWIIKNGKVIQVVKIQDHPVPEYKDPSDTFETPTIDVPTKLVPEYTAPGDTPPIRYSPAETKTVIR